MNTITVAAAAKVLIISAGLVGLGAANAAEQQASFAVAITLYTISKPMAVAQLCPEGKPLDRVGVSITVTCPVIEGKTAAATEPSPFLQQTRGTFSPPTVFVTF